MFSPNSTPGQWIGGHHRIRAGLQIQIFWEIEFGLYAPGVGHPGREAGPVFPAQTARRLRALPSASLAPILSGWKQTSGGAEMCELRPARPFVCRVVRIQDKTRTAPSNRPRRTSSPRYERTARRAKSILRSPKW